MSAKRNSQSAPSDGAARNPVVWVVGATGLAIGAGLASLFQSNSFIAPKPEAKPAETRPEKLIGTTPVKPLEVPKTVPNDPG